MVQLSPADRIVLQTAQGSGASVGMLEQETGPALFKRVLIATQACVLAWRPMRETGEQTVRTREFLVRLSGRQTKRMRPIIAPALLDALFKRFSLWGVLNEYSIEELQAFADFAFPRRFEIPGKAMGDLSIPMPGGRGKPGVAHAFA
ncbi:hypothetical protein RP726_19640 [Candidatus Methylospira mobilis]|uniref:hypothetical protein n=1 Tax=Candidatus Methylospira mobilis TaxID=1808979 RepID=UPI0028EC2AA7|nr:hypothetical protein [Candidatus Methylospira mobilis]WNV04582.1 hypothetical protein RP726_19640 [Candidatus Methylospira mobilis]